MRKPRSVRPRALVLALASALISPGRADAEDGGTDEHLPCEPHPAGDSQPWNWEQRVLNSFRPDDPPPAFVGAFAGGGRTLASYEVHIWRDSKGIFGELLSPVLDADSPRAELLDVQFDPKSGSLTFTARGRREEHKFVGSLRRRRMKGIFTCGGVSETITLRRIGPNEEHGIPSSSSWASRDQFACAMKLWIR
jgi:hypothetical protein